VNLKRIILVCLSGVLMALSFPRWNLWILAWVGLVPFLWAMKGCTPREATMLGWGAGSLHFGILLYWLLNTMKLYGGLPTAVASAVLLLLIVYLGAYWGVFGALVVYIRSTLKLSPIWFAPPLWCALEALRGSLITGFPWASLGYSQWQVTDLVQIADISGISGLSFLLIWANCALFGLMERCLRRNKRFPWEAVAGTGLGILMVAGSLLYGLSRTRQIMAISETSTKIGIGIAQGSIDQYLKWDAAYQDATMGVYEKQTEQLARKGAQIVVWPETAAPFFFQQRGELRERLLDLAQTCQIEILFGSPAFGQNGDTRTLFNRAYLIGPDRNILGFNDKMHLVPFGEYVPLRQVLFFIHQMVEGIGEFSPGRIPRVLPSESGASFGVMICFESIFPEISRALVTNGADILVNLTNDAWFGKTAGPYQHLSMLTMRAVENRRWIVRAANTGISAMIDPCGRLVAQIPLFERGVLVDKVSRLELNSYYSQHGERFTKACSLWAGGLVVLSLGVAMIRRKARHVFP
jgi:apolipoprotein N-acyltransferase